MSRRESYSIQLILLPLQSILQLLHGFVETRLNVLLRVFLRIHPLLLLSLTLLDIVLDIFEDFLIRFRRHLR
jgi:hypothetical protein